MTAKEPETSADSSGAQDGADDELWLTYLNYDPRIQQAVRRLGALSSQNVDVFRALLLKDRDRSRLKDYEAESVRRLQGEVFVGDEELQRTLIVLTAEDPRFGEELKRLVRATGKPEQLDQAVATIRSGKPVQIKPVPVADPAPSPPPPPPEESAAVPQEQPHDAVVVPLRKEAIAPAPATPKAATPRMVMREEPPQRRSLKPLIVAGVVILLAALGAVWVLPGIISGNKTIAVQSPPAPLPAKPQAVATAKPAPAVDNPNPSPADNTASASPPLRPASTQPEASAAPQPEAPADSAAAPKPQGADTPVAGEKYKVVRGDMLSQIALQVYGDASKFRMIQAANPGLRNKPDRILVDQVIFIPPDKR